jgi:hypothetical protein
MKYEITTRELSAAEMWQELSFVSKQMQELGQENCSVIFGFAWGNKYYKTGVWEEVLVPFSKLVEVVENVEQSGFGRLGPDDLFVRTQSLEIEFLSCNDSDTHLSHGEQSEVGEFFFESWESRGFAPVRQAVHHAGY